MEALLTFTFKDFIAFMIPLFIGGLIFNRRRKRKEVRVKFSFLWLVLIVGGILEICDDIYTTYSYRHNHLYNNDTLTTVFNYDFAKIVFLWGFDLCFYCASSSGVAFKQAVTLMYIACRRIAIFYFDMGLCRNNVSLH
ncbi:hypothetical protein MT441_07770 [Klebsiella variicola]|uniref:hypothetical protein n=3 Tax=Klebsiella pneumoniae complex TaxID=3390273 RepID=UPI0024B1E4D1|nr:hypothetical protein [Klebsiella variicola]MDI9056080.1 hypothetical protein [Klebsiella variicola]